MNQEKLEEIPRKVPLYKDFRGKKLDFDHPSAIEVQHLDRNYGSQGHRAGYNLVIDSGN
jgi:hypothetical protein